MKKTILPLLLLLVNFISAQQISIPGNTTFVVKNDGTLWGWGLNDQGQLCNGTTENKNRPTQIGNSSDWLSVVNSRNKIYAIKKNGTLWGWGDNSDGLLGDGTSTNRTTPSQIGTDSDWKVVVAGANNIIAIKKNGTLWGWGQNYFGQLGNGTTVDKNRPTQIGNSSDWLSVINAGNKVYAIKTNGTLWGWGDNSDGSLGDGTTTNRITPTQIGIDSDWKSVSNFGGSNFALKNNGTLWVWGYNTWSQLGDGTSTIKDRPVQIGTGSNWKTIVNNGQSTFAIKADGTLWKWGYFIMGNGTSTRINTPTRVGNDTDWNTLNAIIDYEGQHSEFYAIKTNGTLWGWGYNAYCLLGYGSGPNYIPTKIGGDSDWDTIYPTSRYVLGLKKSGQIWTWGHNYNGELGNGTFSKNLLPTQIGTDSNWKSVSAGQFTSIALKNNGTLWGWGRNLGGGLLGNSVKWTINSPFQIGTDSDWKITYSNNNLGNFALKNNGTLWVWGNNSDYQLGIGGGNNVKSTITQVGTDRDWKSIGFGNQATFAIKTNGTLWGWGNNSNGNIMAINVTSNNYTILSPTQIGTETNWKAVNGNNKVTFGIKTNGTLWGWGLNNNNLLGSNYISGIVQIGSASDWESISIGSDYALAIKTNGTLWGWGYNGDGLLGDGTSTSKTAPSQIGTDSDWKAVVVGISGDKYAIKTNGTLWVWGNNYAGILGNGTTKKITFPTQIGSDADWESVTVNSVHILAKKTNGKILSWGNNYSGQLGNGEEYLPSSICFTMNNDFVTGESNQTFQPGGVVSDIKVSGTDIKWYISSTGGDPLTSNTSLVNGTTYYASQTVGGCESLSRLAVTITIFNIPNNNFLIETKSETCSGKNNGVIIIKATQTYDYKATINNKTYDFTNNNLTVGDLPPGVYSVCISVVGQTYSQCFSLKIEKGGSLTGKLSSSYFNKVAVEISQGTGPFEVLLNGISQFSTLDKNFVVAVKQGDLLEVSTSVACEGLFSKTIVEFPSSPIVYPNPTFGLIEVSIPENRKEIYLELYSMNSVLISKGTYPVVNQKIQLNLENESSGVYFIKLDLEKAYNLIVIKN